MDKATKAALFSALLFPGLGQFYLKRYFRGLVFILPVLSGTVFLAWIIVQAGMKTISDSGLKDGRFQWDGLVQITADTIKVIDVFYILIVLGLIVVLWILSSLDAYRLGKINN